MVVPEPIDPEFALATDIESMRFQLAEGDVSQAEYYAEAVIEGLARGIKLPEAETEEALREECYRILKGAALLAPTTPLPGGVNSRDDAIAFIRWCCAACGKGYHPDTAFADYRPAFPPGDVAILEALRQRTAEILGDELHAIALDISLRSKGH